MNSSRLLTALVILGITVSIASAQPAAKPTIESRWADLASPDEGKATRALLALSATPKETTAFLQEQLKPVKADAKRVAQLVKALDNANFKIRAQAMAELEYFGKYIKADLEAALKANPGIETKMRVQQLLDKMPKEKEKKAEAPMPKAGGGRNISVSNINGQIRITIDGQVIDLNNLTPPPPPPPPPGPPTGWVRAVRAVNLLEHLATPEAEKMLQSIAAGESDALPTVAAREALERLKK
jgi:hypothetical protein